MAACPEICYTFNKFVYIVKNIQKRNSQQKASHIYILVKTITMSTNKQNNFGRCKILKTCFKMKKNRKKRSLNTIIDKLFA